MHISPIIVFGLVVFAYALTRMPDRFKPAWSRRLKWWQVLAGAAAMVVALLIVMNPEFLALGILGDSAFFDLLVLGISFQFQSMGLRAWHWVAGLVSRYLCGVRMRYQWMVWALVGMISTFACLVQKVVHRIGS